MAINREKVLEAAQKFYEKKKYDKALLEYEKVIREDPTDARILLKAGDLQSKMEKYEGAVVTYEKVGKIYASQGFALKAIAVYKQIRELIQKHLPQAEERYAHIAPRLAELYQQLGLISDALTALDEVAVRFQKQGKDAEAVDTFRRIVELDPTNPLPHLRLAEALSRGQDIEGAVTEFNVAASLLVNVGRRDDALKVYERLLHHRPDPDKARKAAELYLARGQQNDGMQALAKLQLSFQADPKNLDTLQLLAHAFNAIGQASKAIEVQKEMARIARDSGDTTLFNTIVGRLRQQVPHDEAVLRLAQSTAASLNAPTAPGSFEPPRAREVAPAPQPPAPPPPPPPMPTSGRGPVTHAGPPPSVLHQPSTATAFHPGPPRPPPPPPNLNAPRPPARPPVQNLSYESVPPEELEELEPIDSYEDADSMQLEELPEEEPIQVRGRPQTAPYQPAAPHFVAPVAAPQPSQSGPGLAARVAQILADAASFRRVRLYKKAIDTLRGGIEIDPQSVELYETLRQVLYEARQEEQSIDVGLKLAALYVDALDGDSAARVLQDVLALDARHPRALEMLHELGYELAEEGAPLDEDGPIEDTGAMAAGHPDEFEDDIAAPPPRMSPAPVSFGGLDAVDDPFLSEAPLPSFPVEGTGEQPAYVLDNSSEYEAFESRPPVRPASAAPAPEAAAHPTGPTTQGPELEDALEEADFFASRGLFADARTILTDQLARHPSHPLLVERMAELDESEQAARGGLEDDVSYALGAGTLDGLEAAQAPIGFNAATQQVDVEEVFAKFKEGVARQISLDDAQSHYDLGVAYKEMGLTEDAINEFLTAARDETRECVCHSMVGMLELERNNADKALAAFLRGLSARARSEEQEMVLCFEIGTCYELLGKKGEALGYFQRVLRRDPSYRDVESRVRKLSGGGDDRSQVRSSAVTDREFDDVFDDLLDEGRSARKARE